MSAILSVSDDVVASRARFGALDLFIDAGLSSGQTIQGMDERRQLRVDGTLWQLTRWGFDRWQLEKQTDAGSWVCAWGGLNVEDAEVAAYWALRIITKDAANPVGVRG